MIHLLLLSFKDRCNVSRGVILQNLLSVIADIPNAEVGRVRTRGVEPIISGLSRESRARSHDSDWRFVQAGERMGEEETSFIK